MPGRRRGLAASVHANLQCGGGSGGGGAGRLAHESDLTVLVWVCGNELHSSQGSVTQELLNIHKGYNTVAHTRVSHAQGGAVQVGRLIGKNMLRRLPLLRSAAAVSAASAAFGLCHTEAGALPPLSPEKLNQRTVDQSLDAWMIEKDSTGEHYIVSRDNPAERYKAPDGGNFVEGYPHPPFIRQRPWQLLRNMWSDRIHRQDDVWIATYPKCGTTFMEQIVLLLRHGGDPDVLDNSAHNNYNLKTRIGKVWAEQRVRVMPDPTDATGPPRMRSKMTLDEFAAMPAKRTLKTHSPRAMFLDTRPVSPPSLASSGRHDPLAEGTKVIYVSRAAADACVSSYYHAANPHRLGFPFDAWAKLWLSGLFEHGRWSDHVAGWRAEASQNPGQVLWCRYEDLKAQPHREVRRIAEFLSIDADDALIDKVVVGSGFDVMRARAGEMSYFFRKGVVGDAARHFSPALYKEFDAALQEQMRGVDDPYSSA